MFVTYIHTDKHTLWLPESLDLSDRETKNWFTLINITKDNMNLRMENTLKTIIISVIINSNGGERMIAPAVFSDGCISMKKGLEVPNFVTFPNSLLIFRKSFFWLFTVVFGYLEGAG